MNRRTRRVIFYVLVAVFFVIGGGVVGYAEGWRIDFAKWRFEKIGAIYVRSFPENASIYLNGKPAQNQSGFLSPGTLISDLLPNNYRVSLKSPGYDDWEENAVVSPSLVAQFKYAVLVPQTGIQAPTGTVAQLTIATSTLINPSDPTEKIVIGKNKISIFSAAQATTTVTITVSGKNVAARWITGSLMGILQNDGQLYLYNTNAQQLRKLADDTKIFTATPDGSMIATLENKSLEIFSLSDTTNYYRFNIPDLANVSQVIWYKDLTHLFIVYPDHVSFLDFADTSLINFTTVATGTSPLYDASTNSLYTKNASGTVLRYDFSG